MFLLANKDSIVTDAAKSSMNNPHVNVPPMGGEEVKIAIQPSPNPAPEKLEKAERVTGMIVLSVVHTPGCC